MKRTLLCLAALLLCLLCGSALAARQTDAGFSGQVQPYATDAQAESDSLSLALDGDAATCWHYIGWSADATDDQAEATFYFRGESIGTVWIRNGDCSSYENYLRNAVPMRIQVRLWSGWTWTDYHYLMDDIWDMTSWNADWQNGYQALHLPQLHTNVTRVELFIPHWREGDNDIYHKNNLCISDIAFTSDGASGGAVSPVSPVSPSHTPWQDTARVNYSAPLLMRLATRSGPSTLYDELGSYFKAGDSVTVLTRAYDSRNEIWWMQVEFRYLGTPRRAYTGVKRVDISLQAVPEEQAVATARVNTTCWAYWGPGNTYTRHDSQIAQGTTGVVFNVENGYVQLEIADSNGKNARRVWIPAEAADRLD